MPQNLIFIYLFISFFFNLGDPFNALALFFLGAQEEWNFGALSLFSSWNFLLPPSQWCWYRHCICGVCVERNRQQNLFDLVIWLFFKELFSMLKLPNLVYFLHICHYFWRKNKGEENVVHSLCRWTTMAGKRWRIWESPSREMVEFEGKLYLFLHKTLIEENLMARFPSK